MSADVARSHDDDGGGEDLPLHTIYPTVAWLALLTEFESGGARRSGECGDEEEGAYHQDGEDDDDDT
nr:hypothetical protein [Tanacetum cinerariifolium]